MGRAELTAPNLTRFDRFAFGAVALFLAAVFAYLFGHSLLRSAVFDPSLPGDEHVLYVWDNVAVNLAMVLGWLALMRLALRFEGRIRLGVLTGAALAVTFVLGAAWALVLRAEPINDAGILHYSAAELARGNVSELWRHEVYLRTNPFQAGYLQYSELLQRVFGRHSTLPQQLMNAAFLTAAYGAVLDVTWRALRDRRVQIVTVLLLVCCVQPVCYVTFLYGNLPGLCLALWALACLSRWVTGRGRRWILPALALMAAAVVLKPNYLIVALAAALVTALWALGSRRFAALAVCAALLAVPAAADRLARAVLEARTGFPLGEGAPQTTWLAMGMQEGPLAPGWYNRYSLTLMERAELDPDAALSLNRGDIAQRLAEFAADPAYALSFYHEKMISQWTETTFEALLVNRVMPRESPAPAVAESLLSGDAARALTLYMEGYTLTLYLGFALGAGLAARALWGRRRVSWRRAFGPLALMIAVVGGFCYHMLFEAKSQYLMVYLPMMAPLSAMGLCWRRGVKAPDAS